MPKDRGAEQGDVDGALECSLALGMVAAVARLRVPEQQAEVPWVGAHDPADAERLQYEQRSGTEYTTFSCKMQQGGPDKHIRVDDPRHALQENGGLA